MLQLVFTVILLLLLLSPRKELADTRQLSTRSLSLSAHSLSLAASLSYAFCLSCCRSSDAAAVGTDRASGCTVLLLHPHASEKITLCMYVQMFVPHTRTHTHAHKQMFVHMQCTYICACFKINKYVCTHPHKYIDFCSYMYVCVRFCWQKQFLGAQNFLAPWPINGLYGNAACNNYR